MKLIRMTGGLGNQMFILAFYMSLKRIYPDVKIDLSEAIGYKLHNGYEIDRVFDVHYDRFILPKWLKKGLVFLFFKRVKELCYQQYEELDFKRFNSYSNVYFSGYFQSEKFFLDVESEVRRVCTFNLSVCNSKTLDCLSDIKASNSVSVHIRRGDYLSPKNYAEYGGICTVEYYKKAIREISEKVDDIHFFVFSDDPKWVSENFDLQNATIVDWNSGNDSWQDMFLMSKCKHNIIANSSFSWWGAWLNENKNKTVIAPSRWFNSKATPNIIPSNWTII